MRIDPDTCRDPILLAAEVRRLQGVIAARESERVSQKCDCPGADNAARQDTLTGDTPAAHATPRESTSQGVCTLTDAERALLVRLGSDTREWDKYSSGRPWFVTVKDAAIIRGILERLS
jgi:hypothetical protein